MAEHNDHGFMATKENAAPLKAATIERAMAMNEKSVSLPRGLKQDAGAARRALLTHRESRPWADRARRAGRAGAAARGAASPARPDANAPRRARRPCSATPTRASPSTASATRTAATTRATASAPGCRSTASTASSSRSASRSGRRRRATTPRRRARRTSRLRQTTTKHYSLGVLEVPAALDVLAAVVRVLRAAGAEDLLARLVVRFPSFLIGQRLVSLPKHSTHGLEVVRLRP